MKHRIAIYSNGYNGSITLKAIEGIKKYAAIKDCDIHFYISFAANNRSPEINAGQLNIYDLAKLDEYDGLIVFSNLLNNIPTAEKLCTEANAKGIPVVSVGMQIDGISCVQNNNEDGMTAMLEHLVDVHGAKSFAYIGGAKEHVDTIDRERVVRKVLGDKGIEIKDSDVFYADWINEKAIEIADHLAGPDSELPDAIICANDIMALAVSTELYKLGYNVPGDVIVTGFDHIDQSGVSYPALTTVDQDYETIGYRSCEVLYDIIEGRSSVSCTYVSSKLIVGESCGCNNAADSGFNTARREFCMNMHARSERANYLNHFMRAERSKILASTDYEEMKKNLSNFYASNNAIFAGNYYLMLNKYYFLDAALEESEVLSRGYKADFDPAVAINVGQAGCDSIDEETGMPGFIKKDGEQHIYFFYPLQKEQYNYGYVVFRDGTYIIQDDFRIYEYLERMEQNLSEFRINLRLELVNKELRYLYDKDPMTGLYNRFCFVSHAVPIVEESKNNGRQSLVMFIDINSMKKINDRYGHAYGDRAITTVANAIRNSIKEDNEIGIRYGGDEFIVIAGNADSKHAEDLRRSIISFVEKENRLGVNPFKFSISVGYVLTDPKSKRTVNDYVDEADRLMYDIKNEYHAKHPND